METQFFVLSFKQNSKFWFHFRFFAKLFQIEWQVLRKKFDFLYLQWFFDYFQRFLPSGSPIFCFTIQNLYRLATCFITLEICKLTAIRWTILVSQSNFVIVFALKSWQTHTRQINVKSFWGVYQSSKNLNDDWQIFNKKKSSGLIKKQWFMQRKSKYLMKGEFSINFLYAKNQRSFVLTVKFFF